MCIHAPIDLSWLGKCPQRKNRFMPQGWELWFLWSRVGGHLNPTDGYLSRLKRKAAVHSIFTYSMRGRRGLMRGVGSLLIPYTTVASHSLSFSLQWDFSHHFLLFFFFKRKAHLLLWYWKVDHKDLPLVNGLCYWCLVTKKNFFYLNNRVLENY